MDLTKMQVPQADVNHSKLDVSSTHITTGNFMQLYPVYYRHMMPNEHIKGQMSALSRLAPVAVPTYGRCRINLRAFFVPYSSVWRHFDTFVVDTIGSDYTHTSLVDSVPIIKNSVFLTLFQNVWSRLLDSTDPDDAAIINDGRYDFQLTGVGYYVFTDVGRRYYKILVSLGYRIIWDSKDTTFSWSALPLLSFARVYYDYYANTAYYNSIVATRVSQLFEYNNPNTVFSLNGSEITYIFNLVDWVMYDGGNDVYLGAWDNPMSPNTGLGSTDYRIDDIHGSGSAYAYVRNNDSGLYYQPNMVQSSGGNFIGTQFVHQALKSLTDFVKRNQMSGALAADRYLARFGVKLPNSTTRRCYYVNGSSVDINFGDVMQTVNTAAAGDPSNLGDYSGKGIGNGNLSFDFTADTHGMFIITYTIQPVAHLFQGYDRNNRCIRRSQFLQNEFDNMGVDSIEKGEVYVSKDESYATAGDYLGVFGFAPRYYEKKQKGDFVTGDFVIPSMMAGGDSWHLNRVLDNNSFGGINLQTHSFFFMAGEDGKQYNRIFQNTDEYIDNFYLVFHTAAESLAPCKSLFDTYDFDELGNKIELNVNGAKVN